MENNTWGWRDHRRTELVDTVIQALPEIGPYAAARVLVDQGVPFRVVCRVINEPARRRRQSVSG